MKRILISAALITSLFLTTGLSYGQNGKETRDVKNFKRVNFGVSGNLNIHIGPEFRLVIEGDKDELERTITEVSGEKLIIKRENWNFSGFNSRVTVDITMPAIEGLSVSGSGTAEIEDAVKSEDLELNVSGSGKILTSMLTVDNLNCGISGSGNIISGTKGNAKNAEISISGSGNFDGESLTIAALDVKISGSGDCHCFVSGTLDASVSGSGDITYGGDPRINARVSGSGHVRSK